MSRDYKSRRSTASSGGKGSVMLGIFIGYTLGIVSAIGIWFYLEKAPSPFLTEEQVSEYDASYDRSDNTKQTEIRGAPVENTHVAKVEEKAQFDFYKILPSADESVMEYEMPQAVEKPRIVEKPVPIPQSSSSSVSPSLSPSRPPPAVKRDAQSNAATETYYLQVGSFRSSADADNLKARLALLGVMASVQSADLSEKGIWYRVRVGPFAQKTKVDQVYASLRENGIEAQFIRVR